MRKCRSFLSSLLITTWRPLSRPPSLISWWVVMPQACSKELLYEEVSHSCSLRPDVIFWCNFLTWEQIYNCNTTWMSLIVLHVATFRALTELHMSSLISELLTLFYLNLGQLSPSLPVLVWGLLHTLTLTLIATLPCAPPPPAPPLIPRNDLGVCMATVCRWLQGDARQCILAPWVLTVDYEVFAVLCQMLLLTATSLPQWRRCFSIFCRALFALAGVSALR